MKAVRPVTASKWAPSLQMKSLGSHSMSGREKEGKKERTVSILFSNNHLIGLVIVSVTVSQEFLVTILGDHPLQRVF